MKKIYSVNYHTKPGKKTHNAWFTTLSKTESFTESLKKNSKVLDYRVFSLIADVSTVYKDGDQENIELLENVTILQ